MVRRLLELAVRIGSCAAETEDERIRRLIWSATLALAVPIGVVVALAFATLELPLAAALWALPSAFWLFQLVLFFLLRRGLNSFALASQISCVLFGFVGAVGMGGPVRSGGSIIIGLIGPIYALVFPRPRRAAWLLIAYVVSIAASMGLTGRVPWAQALPPIVNLVMFGISLALISIFIFATLLYFVRERDRALSLLREAQEKISRLLESSPRASETVPEWSRSVAKEICTAIGAEAIGIWEIEDGRLTSLSGEGLAAPSIEELESMVADGGPRFIEKAGRIAVPLTGMSGELCGAAIVSGRAVVWDDGARRLLTGLAHQLGAALDMSRLRRQLAAAEERRARTRREMQERGIATLQLCPRCGRCYDHTGSRCEVDGAQLEFPRTLPYRLVDRYRFLQVLGQGGMGMVFAAHDEKLGRDVAVKLIRPEHFNDAGLKQRFEREARTVARIQHHGVIDLHDSGELEDGTAYIVMEKLTGCDLGSMIRRCGRGTPSQVAVLIRQGSAALAAAHRAGVVHRDIKPENIFLVEEPDGFRVKVLDFGLAKSMTLERGLTQTGMVMGTPRYMSPEQVQGEDVDAGSDIYSFAAVCYEALTSRKAVPGDDLAGILINVRTAVPTPPSMVIQGLPTELDSVFASALSKDRSRRPGDIERWGTSAARLLEKVPPDSGAAGWSMSGEALSAPPESPPSEAGTLDRATSAGPSHSLDGFPDQTR